MEGGSAPSPLDPTPVAGTCLSVQIAVHTRTIFTNRRGRSTYLYETKDLLLLVNEELEDKSLKLRKIYSLQTAAHFHAEKMLHMIYHQNTRQESLI